MSEFDIIYRTIRIEFEAGTKVPIGIGSRSGFLRGGRYNSKIRTVARTLDTKVYSRGNFKVIIPKHKKRFKHLFIYVPVSYSRM